MNASKKTLEAVQELGRYYQFTFPTYGSRAPKLYRVRRRRDGVLLGAEYHLSRLVAIAQADLASQNSLSSGKFG